MICPFCDQPARWCENKEIYGRNYGKSYMVWLCKPCDAYVGCHCNTKRPLGTIANAETRKWRKKVHAELDPIWRNHHNPKGRRARLYERLSKHFGYEYHTGESDVAACKKALAFIRSELQPNIVSNF